MGRVCFQFVGLVTIVWGFLIPSVHAKTWVVDVKGPIKTIRTALDRAHSGDTIVIMSGTYREKALEITQPVTLLGRSFPVLDGEFKYEILTVKSDDVHIEGLLFKNSGSSGFMDIAALRLVNAQRVAVLNNRFENNFFGIYSQHSKQCRIERNVLRSGGVHEMKSANGIHCWKSSEMQIRNNRVSGHRDGIYFEFVTHSIIQDNKSIGNARYGLHFMFSHDDVYERNEIRRNGAGVAVMYSKRVTMKHNIFAENWGNAAYGILLKEISDSDIAYNSFQENTIAIFAESVNRAIIRYNHFGKNGWAIKMMSSCSDVQIANNNFTGNTFDVSSNGNLVSNKFSGNYWDKYEGYDLNRDGIGDIPHRPVTFYSVITEKNPGAMMLFRSFFVGIMEKAERVLPSLTPVAVLDEHPKIKRIEWTKGEP